MTPQPPDDGSWRRLGPVDGAPDLRQEHRTGCPGLIVRFARLAPRHALEGVAEQVWQHRDTSGKNRVMVILIVIVNWDADLGKDRASLSSQLWQAAPIHSLAGSLD